jgi:HD-GYP domain-containing protein (c-di-GMP phosphodiesterase class II)
LVILSPSIPLEKIGPFLKEEGIPFQSLADTNASELDGSAFYVVDPKFLESRTLSNEALGVLVLCQREDEFRNINFPQNLLADYCIEEINLFQLRNLIRSALLKEQMVTVRQDRDTQLHRLRELNRIGIALSTERNPDRLMKMILQKSREITSADAGSIYVVETDEQEKNKKLRFKILQNDSIQLSFEECCIPMTTESVAGYVAVTGEPLNIPNVHRLPEDVEYRFNKDIDLHSGYRTESTLAVAMKNYKGEIIGVIQLINRKKNFGNPLRPDNYATEIEPFDAEDLELVTSLASQAAVAFENNQLIQNIERLFEGFVTASVTAIESRDPTTSGHSFRVAEFTVQLAETVSAIRSGKFHDVTFSSYELKEMRYAALLHDFGKVGVRENVLVKAKKLYPSQLELIRHRFAYYKKAWELELYKSKLNIILTRGPDEFIAEAIHLENAFKARLEMLDDYLDLILQTNEPTVTIQDNFEKLRWILSDTHMSPPGVDEPLLRPEEVQLLSIRKGSLNEKEREEIESHVIHTFLFLSKIPWTSELKNVPEIAYGHHEKLNGSGYPNRLNGKEIPIQTRMMTISDIYDALTASDRPYKRAVPSEHALEILQSEVEKGQVDSDLFEIFVDAKIFQHQALKR